MGELTHINADGQVHMVEVGGKEKTLRRASAHARVHMERSTLTALVQGNMKKGDVLATARVAAIMAAKRTHELIPLCHPIPISGIEITAEPFGDTAIDIVCTVTCTHETGVEMEALTGASVCALTVYDMCKAVDRAMVIGEIMLLTKSGGKSGDFVREGIDTQTGGQGE